MIFERKINYYETDRMQIVHHSNYIRFLEEARINWMDDMGLPYYVMEEAGIMIPVLGVKCDYKSPARFGDTILIDVHIKEYTGVKMIMEYIITDKETGNVLVTAETKHCMTNNDLKPINLKKVNPEMHEVFIKTMEY